MGRYQFACQNARIRRAVCGKMQMQHALIGRGNWNADDDGNFFFFQILWQETELMLEIV